MRARTAGANRTRRAQAPAGDRHRAPAHDAHGLAGLRVPEGDADEARVVRGGARLRETSAIGGQLTWISVPASASSGPPVAGKPSAPSPVAQESTTGQQPAPSKVAVHSL